MAPLQRLIRRAVVLIGVAAVVTALAGGAPKAQATKSWLTVPGGLPLFDLDAIAPGDHGSATLTVTNPQAFPVTFSIAVTDLVNDDNGCVEPEAEIGDTTCGPGGGELQFDLSLALTATGAADRTVATGTVVGWVSQAIADPIPLAGNEARTYRIGYELPIGATNLVQSDGVSFAFELRLDQTFDSEVASDPPPAILDATKSLPRTGNDTLVIVLIAIWAVAAGFSLLRMTQHRRRHH